MRHHADAPNGTMDLSLHKTLLVCKAEGFQQFSLGMSPSMAFERASALPRKSGRKLFDATLEFHF